MTIGIQCLLAENLDRASGFAKQLIKFNENRKLIESDMVLSAIEELDDQDFKKSHSIVLTNDNWHQGVVGILASRLKEKYYRPTITFANFDDEIIKGSGRSIDSFHLRDALDLISKRHPNLIQTFGGHAMAAGLSIKKNDFKKFSEIFELTCQEFISPDLLNQTVEYDKSIEPSNFNYALAKMINEQVWGQGFPAPFFVDNFDVVHQEVIGGKTYEVFSKK